jgi:hypothetical protein
MFRRNLQPPSSGNEILFYPEHGGSAGFSEVLVLVYQLHGVTSHKSVIATKILIHACSLSSGK